MQPKYQKVPDGFRINWINLVDIDTGVTMWHTNNNYGMSFLQYHAVLPANSLDSRGMNRTIGFSSSSQLDYLKLKHKEYFQGNCIEEWESDFGTVLANSVETWDTTFVPKQDITSASANLLSGNLKIETNFFNGIYLLATINIVMFYEE